MPLRSKTHRLQEDFPAGANPVGSLYLHWFSQAKLDKNVKTHTGHQLLNPKSKIQN